MGAPAFPCPHSLFAWYRKSVSIHVFDMLWNWNSGRLLKWHFVVLCHHFFNFLQNMLCVLVSVELIVQKKSSSKITGTILPTFFLLSFINTSYWLDHVLCLHQLQSVHCTCFCHDISCIGRHALFFFSFLDKIQLFANSCHLHSVLANYLPQHMSLCILSFCFMAVFAPHAVL